MADPGDHRSARFSYRRAKSSIVITGAGALLAATTGIVLVTTRPMTLTAPTAATEHIAPSNSSPDRNAMPRRSAATLEATAQSGRLTAAAPRPAAPPCAPYKTWSPLAGHGPALAPPWKCALLAVQAGEWALDGRSNDGPTVPDGAHLDGGTAHPGRASDVSFGSSHGTGYGIFGGKDSQITTSGPVVNTAPGNSFTVAAWVYLHRTNAFATAVSQDGAVNSGFYLQYSQADNRWAFARTTGDTMNARGIRALAAQPPAFDNWTHLVGVYDTSAQQLRLYVNGALQGEAADTTPFAAHGDLAIGRARFNGRPTDWFDGSIKEVQVYNQALNAKQVGEIW